MKRLFVVLAAMTLTAALAHADACAPAKVTDLAVLSTGLHSVALTFTDSGDDCNTGTAASWELRYSTLAPIDEGNYYNATVYTTGTPLGAGGTAQCFSDFNTTKLACSTTYYWAITFTDAAGNRSPVSNSVSSTLPSCSSHVIAECP